LFFLTVHGVHHDRQSGQRLGNLSRRVEAVEAWHGQIEDDKIGMKLEGSGNGFLPILGLQDLACLQTFEQVAERGPDHRVIVRDQDSRRHASRPNT
jgi:hypothetical protein